MSKLARWFWTLVALYSFGAFVGILLGWHPDARSVEEAGFLASAWIAAHLAGWFPFFGHGEDC